MPIHPETSTIDVSRQQPSNNSVEYTFDDGRVQYVSTRERVIKEVPEPARHVPTNEEFFSPIDPLKPNLDFLKVHFAREGRLTEDQVLYILRGATEVLLKEPNMVDVEGPVAVCGDIHGQFYDLLRLLEIGGDPASNRYLFLGDYVDRGSFSIECVLYLWAHKIWFPNTFFLLRGNHESRHLTSNFTFHAECLHKYSARIYNACVESFCALPLAALMNKQFFCVHGGLSPELQVLSDLKTFERFKEPPNHGLMCDLLWADPAEDFGNELTTHTFLHNASRGCSFSFTYKAVCQFLERNKLVGLIRAHEVQQEGYRVYRLTPRNFPAVMTIFSAPNYMDMARNKAAIIKFRDNISVRQFSAVPHPYVLPNFMDAFSWSLPFVRNKLQEMLVGILEICPREELDEEEIQDKPPSNILEEDSPIMRKLLASALSISPNLLERKTSIKKKIVAVARLTRVYAILQENSDLISEMKARSVDGRLPYGSILGDASEESSTVVDNAAPVPMDVY